MTEWDSSPEGKAYHKKAHQEWRKANKEHANDYHREYMRKWRKANQERLTEYRHNYYMATRGEPRNPKRVKYPDPPDTHSITQEEWLKKYGYPMGDTTGWENWQGWDTRIRKGAEE